MVFKEHIVNKCRVATPPPGGLGQSLVGGACTLHAVQQRFALPVCLASLLCDSLLSCTTLNASTSLPFLISDYSFA